jgi:hypothetical protein
MLKGLQMNTPSPCVNCSHLYYDIFASEDPGYGAECKLGYKLGNEDCKHFKLWESRETIKLSEKDSEVFLDAISNPREPNEALKKAAEEYKKNIK